jgi:hypothetical protein
VPAEIGKTDTARGGENLVGLERLPNLCVARCRDDIVSGEPDYWSRISQSRVTRIGICKEL